MASILGSFRCLAPTGGGIMDLYEQYSIRRLKSLKAKYTVSSNKLNEQIKALEKMEGQDEMLQFAEATKKHVDDKLAEIEAELEVRDYGEV